MSKLPCLKENIEIMKDLTGFKHINIPFQKNIEACFQFAQSSASINT